MKDHETLPLVPVKSRTGVYLYDFDGNRYIDAVSCSSGVEAALKMSYHYHPNLGKRKALFLSLSNSYHGETIGTLSVWDVELYPKMRKTSSFMAGM
jgi:adenosylmethionine-8-amino-7-oxononanoate aminotransferase